MVSIQAGNLIVYRTEIFPSVFRGIGLGIVSLIGSIGAVIAPTLLNIMK